MNQADALDIVQSALWTVIVASGPAVGAAMAIGIVIALLQALTQVQEMTLTFIPKIVAILVICSLTAPFIGAVIYTFAEQVYARIEDGLLSLSPDRLRAAHPRARFWSMLGTQQELGGDAMANASTHQPARKQKRAGRRLCGRHRLYSRRCCSCRCRRA